MWPCREWATFVSCFFYSTPAHTSLLMSGSAIPTSRYSSSTLVGLRPPVIDLHASLSSGSSLEACGDLAQTIQPTSGVAVTADSSCCANCVEPPRPSNGGPIYRFWACRPCGPAGLPQLTYDMTTDYNKTDGPLPTTRKQTRHNLQKTQESAFAQTTIPTNIHTDNRIFTNIILMADKHIIPKGKMHSNCRLLPEDIVCKITQRNNIRRANTCDPALKLLNKEITSDIQKHKQNIWQEHTHTLEDHTWSIQQSTTTHTKHIHNIQH